MLCSGRSLTTTGAGQRAEASADARDSGAGRLRVAASPAWSPDGTRLAFTNPAGVWMQSAGSGEPQRVGEAAFNALAGPLFHSLAWSPDGKALLFVDGISPTLGNLSASTIGVLRLD